MKVGFRACRRRVSWCAVHRPESGQYCGWYLWVPIAGPTHLPVSHSSNVEDAVPIRLSHMSKIGVPSEMPPKTLSPRNVKLTKGYELWGLDTCWTRTTFLATSPMLRRPWDGRRRRRRHCATCRCAERPLSSARRRTTASDSLRWLGAMRASPFTQRRGVGTCAYVALFRPGSCRLLVPWISSADIGAGVYRASFGFDELRGAEFIWAGFGQSRASCDQIWADVDGAGNLP